MSHRNLKLCLAVLLIAAVACSTSAPAPTGTPTPDLAATAQATATAAFDLTATPARATQVAAQAIVEATAQAQPMVEAIQKLVDDGYLDRSEGKYFAPRDFYESWAQLNWYTYQDTGYAPANFVVRADAQWQSASDKADWWNSGCGFVFREQDVDNHYLAYLGLDGWVYFSAFRNGNFVDLGGARYGKVGVPSGGALLTLMVDGDKFTFFVNGERVYSKVDQAFASGRLAMTLLSGTNKDYGTRCLMKNVELWELK